MPDNVWKGPIFGPSGFFDATFDTPLAEIAIYWCRLKNRDPHRLPGRLDEAPTPYEVITFLCTKGYTKGEAASLPLPIIASQLKKAVRELTNEIPAKENDSQSEKKTNDWIPVTEAISQLPFVKDLKSLYRYAEAHPEKLRLRPHPTHKRRRQASAADVMHLVIEHNNYLFDAMGGPMADNLLPISEAELAPLASRLADIRAGKRKK